MSSMPATPTEAHEQESIAAVVVSCAKFWLECTCLLFLGPWGSGVSCCLIQPPKTHEEARHWKSPLSEDKSAECLWLNLFTTTCRARKSETNLKDRCIPTTACHWQLEVTKKSIKKKKDKKRKKIIRTMKREHMWKEIQKKNKVTG